MNPSRFAARVFRIAAIYGFLVLPPMYFLEARTGRDYPPPITHPEFYYGFVGVGLAFQFVFWILVKDPVRYRAMMIPSIIEKVSFGIALIALVSMGRTAAPNLVFASIDLVLAGLFFAAYVKTQTA